jgi:hypothetical protein
MPAFADQIRNYPMLLAQLNGVHRDLGIWRRPLNRRLDPEGKVVLGLQWMLPDSGVTVRRRYRKLDIVRRLSNALSRLVSMSGR